MKRILRRIRFKISLFFLIFVSLFSCSFDRPDMPDVSAKILKIETDSGALEERLSVFLMYKDENGKNDYSSIQLMHLESGLTWILNRDNTSFFSSSQLRSSDAEKTIWAGSNKIASPFGKIPLGEYSIIIEDLSGNRAVKKLAISETENPEAIPFDFQIQDKKWKIEGAELSDFKKFFLILSGADKQPLFVQILSPAYKYGGDLSSLLEKYPDSRYVQCMGQNGQGMAYLTKYRSLY